MLNLTPMSVTTEPIIDLADEPRFSLGERIRKARGALDQAQAARLVEDQLRAMGRTESVDRQKLGRWERGKTPPNAYELAAIALAFQVRVGWLMELPPQFRCISSTSNANEVAGRVPDRLLARGVTSGSMPQRTRPMAWT